MDDLIKELDVLAPYLMYIAIAIVSISLVVAIVKKILNQRQQKLKAQEREANLLFKQLLTPDDLDIKDPIISQQMLARH